MIDMVWFHSDDCLCKPCQEDFEFKTGWLMEYAGLDFSQILEMSVTEMDSLYHEHINAMKNR